MGDPDQSRDGKGDQKVTFWSPFDRTPHPVVLFFNGEQRECVFSPEKTLLAEPAQSDEWGRLNDTEEHGKTRKTAENSVFFTFCKTGL